MNRDAEIFADAVGLSAGERAAFLDQACAGDAGLRARVEALLRGHDAAHSFLQQPLAARPALAPEEKPGDRIGRYKLLERIGEGGCGVVWAAEQSEPVRRRVALKVIKLGMDTKEVIARFEAERQALALMDHPNIAKVLDAGATATGRPFFVMELVHGVPITRFCDEAQLPLMARLKLFIDVCHAIQHAHQKGIIHRDLKPSNILVSVNDGAAVPKVIDFGIAKATQGRLTDQTIYTAFEQFIGTPAYMSPEQAVMTSLDIDTRSDIYSLGVLLYELLTGRQPFDTEALLQSGLDEMRRHLREVDPPKPSTRLSTMEGKAILATAQHRHTEPPKLISLIRGDLDWIVMKALEKDRTRRYETANSLADDLRRHLQHEPVAARPPSAAYRARKFIRRHRVGVAASAAIGAALVLGILLATWQAVRATRAEHEQSRLRMAAERAATGEVRQRQVAEQETRRAVEAAERLRLHAYASDMRAAQIALEDFNLGRCRELLEQYVPKAGEVDVRGFEWRYLWNESRSRSTAEFNHPSPVIQAVLFPDRKTLVSECLDGVVAVWDAVSKREIRRLPSADARGVVTPKTASSPDGSLLAVCQASEVVIYDTANWTVAKRLPATAWQAAFTPDAKEVILLCEDRLVFWNLTTGVTTAVPRTPGDESRERILLAHDGRRLFLSHRTRNTIEVWDVPPRKLVQTLKTVGQCISLAVSPDGRWLAAGRWDGMVSLLALPDLKMVATIKAHPDIARGVAFSPDSKLLATGGSDQLVKLWKVRESSSAKVPALSLQDTFRGHRDGIFGLAFSSDGQQLVSAGHDGTARLWPLAVAGPQPVLFDLPPTIVTSFKTGRFLSSPHGLIWTVGNDGAATGWDFRTGRAARSARFPVDWENIRWSGWIPRFDGRLVYAERDRGIAVWDPITARSELLVPGAKAAEAQFLGVVVHQDRVFVVLWGEESQQAEAWMPGAVTPCREPWTRALSSGNNGQRIAQSPDGKHLVRFQTDILPQPDYSPVVTTLGDAPVLRKLVGHRWHIYSCVFSDDSKLVASGSWDATARVWDVASGECVRELRGHLNGVHCQQFTPDGRTLITVGDDSKIRFWHLRTGGEMLVLPGRELILWRPYRSWLLPPNSADGLLMGPTDNQVRFIPVPTLAAIDEEIRRKAAAQP